VPPAVPGAIPGAVVTGGRTAGSIIRIILISLAGAGGVVLGGLVIGIILTVTGNPKPCVDRTITPSTAAATALRADWDAFKAAAAAGPATVTFSETQVTSRGVEYIDEKDAPVEDLQVYFCPDGTAQATGKVKALGLSANVVVSGTLDLSGEDPRIVVDSVKAGNLPGFLGTRVVNTVLDQGDLREFEFSVRLTSISYGDTEVTLGGRK
jgi:hypothetical protein